MSRLSATFSLVPIGAKGKIMALVPTFMDVTYRDDANTTRTIRYRLAESADDSGSNMDDVLIAAGLVEGHLAALTGDHIDYYDIVLRAGGGTHAADDATTNQITAFSRIKLANNDAGELQVPAWRFSSYEMNAQLMLSDNYDDYIDTNLVALLRDVASGQLFDSVEWTQSRTRQLRGKRIG